MDSAKIDEDFTAGKVGIEIGGNWNGAYPGTDVVKKNGNAAILLPYAMPSADAQPFKIGIGWPVNQYTVVNKNCKNPDAVIKIMNLYVKENQGVSADDYTKFTGGNRGWDSPAAVNDPNASTREYQQISAALTTKDTSKLTGSSLGKYNLAVQWQDSQDQDYVGNWLQVASVGFCCSAEIH